MSTNYLTGLCNSDNCAHPCCWNYYRKLIKHQVSPRERQETKSVNSVEIPHQSINTISADLIGNTNGNIPSWDLHRQLESKQNSLMEYLISRKKFSVPNIPANPRGRYLNDATNLNSVNNKVSILDVHEVFDLEELQNDWRKTFQPKDYYIWMPGNKEVKGAKDEMKKRLIKTPILQLAPVTDSRMNSGLVQSTRRDPSSVGCGSETFNLKSRNQRVKTISKSFSKIDFPKDIVTFKKKEAKNVKENTRQKSLEATLNQAKMQIHKSSTKQFLRNDLIHSSQIYLMDDNFHNKFRDRCSSSQSKEPPTSPIDSEAGSNRHVISYNNLKRNPIHFKSISIIHSASSENELKLEPLNKRFSPIKSATLTMNDDHESFADDKTSFCDSLASNALSNRSTLNDEDILPGSSLLQMFQTSYKLIQERSETLSDKRKEYQDHTIMPEVQLHKINVSYSRSSKSAPDKKVIHIETPDPPPPTPDVTERFRSMSATVTMNPD